MDLAVEVPRDELGAVASNEMWGEIYDRLAELILAHRTTLVFVNTRRLAERVAHHLAERLGENAVLPHHGSLSRRLRLEAEQRLKNGESARGGGHGLARTGHRYRHGGSGLPDRLAAIDRRGAAAHRPRRPRVDPHSVPKGRLFATTRDELIECAALVRAIRAGELDRSGNSAWPLDILAQQIVAAALVKTGAKTICLRWCAAHYPYRDLARADFDAVIEMLSEGIATQRGRSGAFLHRDQVNGVVRGRRGARLAAITSGGAIPENAQLLGGRRTRRRRSSARWTRISRSRAWPATCSCWAPPRGGSAAWSPDACAWKMRTARRRRFRSGAAKRPAAPSNCPQEVGHVRDADRAAGRTRVDWLMQECGLDRRGAEQAVAICASGRRGSGRSADAEHRGGRAFLR